MSFRNQKCSDLRKEITFTHCVLPNSPRVLGSSTVIKYIDISAVKHVKNYTCWVKKKKKKKKKERKKKDSELHVSSDQVSQPIQF